MLRLKLNLRVYALYAFHALDGKNLTKEELGNALVFEKHQEQHLTHIHESRSIKVRRSKVSVYYHFLLLGALRQLAAQCLAHFLQNRPVGNGLIRKRDLNHTHSLATQLHNSEHCFT